MVSAAYKGRNLQMKTPSDYLIVLVLPRPRQRGVEQERWLSGSLKSRSTLLE